MGQMQRVAVVGAGFMGSGIAESAARAGLDVVVHEPEAAPLARSRERVSESVERAVTRGKLDPAAADALIGRIDWTQDLAAVDGAELVIEAIVEDARAKGTLFQRLDALLPDDTILASNTSSIPIAQIASTTSSASSTAARSCVQSMRPISASAAAGSSLPRVTARSMPTSRANRAGSSPKKSAWPPMS